MTTGDILNTQNTPISVNFGGTGVNTFTAYQMICGGTTSTGPLQSLGSLGTSGQVVQCQGPSSLPIFINMPTGGALLSFQLLTSGVLYTPTSSNVNNILVECLGGGGGGAGVAGSATKVDVGGGGASGGYVRKWITGIGSLYTATTAIGGGGNGGTAGDNSGSAGTATTFADGTFSLSASGGGGGNFATVSSSSSAGAGGATGTSTGGDINCSGSPGFNGYAFFSQATGGNGGSSQYGAGAVGPYLTAAGSTAGNNAGVYGSGGSGAVMYDTNTPNAGGNGSAGIIIVWEFS